MACEKLLETLAQLIPKVHMHIVSLCTGSLLITEYESQPSCSNTKVVKRSFVHYDRLLKPRFVL